MGKRDDTLLEDCEKERAIVDRIFDTLFEVAQPLSPKTNASQPTTTSSTIIRTKPIAKPMVAMLE